MPGSASKSAKEKGFSLGRFDPGLSARGSRWRLVRKGPQLVAFANLWATPDRRELSIDLMRLSRRGWCATSWTICSSQLMLWGKAQGYAPVRPRHGTAVRPAGPPACAAVDPRRRPAVHPRRDSSTISRACADTRRSSGRCGSRATWRPPAGSPLAAVLADVTVARQRQRARGRAQIAVPGIPNASYHVAVGTRRAAALDRGRFVGRAPMGFIERVALGHRPAWWS